MRRNQDLPRGRVERLEIESEALRDNLQGDPNRRELHVYLPPGRAEGAGLPLLVDLVGFTGPGMSHTNWRNFGENVPERLDRLIGEGAMGPVAVAFPDCFTRLGGNQYINSAALGRYEFNWSVGERQRFASPRWLEPDAIRTLLRGLAAGSGDVYARLQV